MKKVVVYGKKKCPHCDVAKNTLNERGIAFDYIDVGEDSVALELIKGMGFTKVPQIFVDNISVGGSEAAATLEV